VVTHHSCTIFQEWITDLNNGIDSLAFAYMAILMM
jgi:hypothetical protein